VASFFGRIFSAIFGNYDEPEPEDDGWDEGGGGGGDPCAGNSFTPMPGCATDVGPEPAPPTPLPPPTPSGPPDVDCGITTAYQGTPKDGQNFVRAGIADPPPDNQLGGYRLASGWFNAVQIQAIATGDTDAGDWSVYQSAAINGTQTIVQGKNLAVRPVSVSPPDDSPDPRAVYKGVGASSGTLDIDWLDNPGQAMFPGLFAASLDFTFTSGVKSAGKTCSVSWSFHLSLAGDAWKMY